MLSDGVKLALLAFASMHILTAIVTCCPSQLLSMSLRFSGSENLCSMLPLHFMKAKYAFDTTLLHDGIPCVCQSYVAFGICHPEQPQHAPSATGHAQLSICCMLGIG